MRKLEGQNYNKLHCAKHIIIKQYNILYDNKIPL